MSINRDMKPYRLQKEETVRTPSGAEKQKWIDMGTVEAAVYKKNDMKVAASATYLESTHIGLTRCKYQSRGIPPCKRRRCLSNYRL